MRRTKRILPSDRHEEVKGLVIVRAEVTPPQFAAGESTTARVVITRFHRARVGLTLSIGPLHRHIVLGRQGDSGETFLVTPGALVGQGRGE